MPATTTTTELFPKNTTSLSNVQAEQQLRIQAGAIRSDIDQTADANNYVLTTEWNVIGQNDASSGPAQDAQTAAKTGFDLFVGAGWTKAQAAGLIANIENESNFNLAAVGDGGQAYGLCQWHPDRQANFAAKFGHDIKASTYVEQLQFVDSELRTQSQEGAAGAALAATTTPEQAGAVVCAQYERPRDPTGQVAAQRGARAAYWYNVFA